HAPWNEVSDRQGCAPSGLNIMTATETEARKSLPLLDRDLSWLEFNQRVLHEAEDDRTPLLERVKFLAIVSSNLDEFFMKRIGLLVHRMSDQTAVLDGAPTRRQRALREKIQAMTSAVANVYSTTIRPELARKGIHLLHWDEVTEAERSDLNELFRRTIYPV